MKIISVKLPDELALKLENEAHFLGAENKSSIIRLALEYYFNTAKSQERRAKSFLSLSQDLCGCISAPSDLATNKDHMKDYGE